MVVESSYDGLMGFLQPAISAMKTMQPLGLLLTLAPLALSPTVARAQTASLPDAPPPNDYADPSSWLCRPDRQDACAIDLTTTVVAADGTLSREEWRANPNAPIDCFYVYPTVSTDPTPHSDMTPDAAERRVIEQQFARFGSVCRTFAPSYRQLTLAGLRARMSAGEALGLERGPGYGDVLGAFRHYLEHDNHGRGFVLIGHSQGASVLTELIRQEIDGQPLQDRLISAMLLGWTVTVAAGGDVGGSFRDIPLCRSSDQTGCVVTFVSFRSTAPPSESSLFGRATDASMVAACTHPAALEGGSAPLHSYLSARGGINGGPGDAPRWAASGPGVETPFVSVPGLLSARCATNEHANYLEVTVHGDASDPRVDDIAGDLTPQWGLHLVDVNLAMGDLVALAREQGAAWLARR